MTEFEVTQEIVDKVLEVVDAGLDIGMGKATPGEMCVEAAVCYALGLPHSDRPTCVGEAVRSFKINLNDSSGWKSKASRAAGLRRLAIAQLGSNQIDQVQFAQKLVMKTVNELLADLFEDLGCKAESVALRKAENLGQAKDAARAARAAADAAANARAAAAAYARAARAARAAAYAADAAAYAASRAAAAYAAAWAAYAAAVAGEVWLRKSAELAVQVLIEMGSPGCAFHLPDK